MIIIQRAVILELLRITKRISNQANEEYEEYNIGKHKMFSRVDEIADIILDLLIIPRDTSVDYESSDKRYFCRDAYYAIIYDYSLGYTDYTAEEILDQLLALKEG